MDMAETANKIASDKLNKVLWDENRQLRRDLMIAYSRLYFSSADIEIDHGRMVIRYGNDGGGNPARLPAGEIPEAAGSHTRRA